MKICNKADYTYWTIVNNVILFSDYIPLDLQLQKSIKMTNYKSFVDFLEKELTTFNPALRQSWEHKAKKYVDGLAGEELRKLIKLQDRRQSGAFFTDSLLAEKVLLLLKEGLTENSIIYDPACGAANLLIAAEGLIVKLFCKSDIDTQLLGTDIHREFVRSAELRLRINLLLHEPLLTKNSFFKVNIATKDGLLDNKYYKKATHIVTNPPFNQVDSLDKLDWAKGKVSAAALFIDKIIVHVNPDTTILAILPDVLRNGTRYQKWREMVEKKCFVKEKILLGQFDRFADIDVFALVLVKKVESQVYTSTSCQIAPANSTNDSKIDDLFEVCVGTVVDNRDAKKGESLSYVISKGLKGWSEVKEVSKKREHLGKSFKSPFVVIKRTSRMGDSQRAIATIINLKNPVFVDNHLIILKPKSGKLNDCKQVLKIFKDKRTDDWLNEQIRCRHLTVKIVSNIPLWK